MNEFFKVDNSEVTEPGENEIEEIVDAKDAEEAEVEEESEEIEAEEPEDGEWVEDVEQTVVENEESDGSDVSEKVVQGPKGSVIKVVPRVKPRVASTVWARLNNQKSNVDLRDR